MNPFLFIIQGLLALLFAGTGALKIFGSDAAVRKLAPSAFSIRFLRILGALELAGAFVLAATGLLNIAPVLMVCTDIGMAVVLIAAVGVHYSRREWAPIPFLVLMLAGAIAVLLGRW